MTFESAMRPHLVTITHYCCPWCVQQRDTLKEIADHIDTSHRPEMTDGETFVLDEYLDVISR
jgi:hypothetical protein